MRGRTGRPLSLLQARCAMLGRALPPTSALAPLHRRRPPSCWAAPVDHCRFRRPAAPCRTGPSPTTSTSPSSCCTVGARPRAGLCMPTVVAFAGSLRHAGQGSTDYHALVSLPCRHPAGSARHRWQATATPGQWRGEAVASRQGGCMGMFHVSPCPCGTLMGWPSRAGSAGRPISAPLHLQAAPRPGGTCPRPAARTHLPQGPTARVASTSFKLVPAALGGTCPRLAARFYLPPGATARVASPLIKPASAGRGRIPLPRAGRQRKGSAPPTATRPYGLRPASICHKALRPARRQHPSARVASPSSSRCSRRRGFYPGYRPASSGRAGPQRHVTSSPERLA